MRYTLPTVRPITLQPLALWLGRFFPEHRDVQEPQNYSLSALASHRCLGFIPLHRQNNAAQHRY